MSEQTGIRIVREQLPIAELNALAEAMYGDLVKAVVDVGRRVMAIGGELHSDEEAILLEDGSAQRDLWGINLYPEFGDERMLEFDSVINIRPSQGNRSRGVDDPEIRKEIARIVAELIGR
jgi:hypothetical protein